MEARIKRGRLLREILKQDRLAPLSSVFQLAWLTAFNEGLFNQAEPKDIAGYLELIDQGIRHTTTAEQFSISLHYKSIKYN